ncbi:hypothetical protein ACRALDRAFT_1070414 [Sodiomyces alcalophilus JCM 7366]|uniref:uncharacterized protein n=1 Tax=Sodiomyces alcalophilus JCM 7366 TaxID=591952 RepID=UPI0039B5D2D8
MPPSTKRLQRPRRDPRQETSVVLAVDSSPTRPAKRRKKAQDAHLSGQTEETESNTGADRTDALNDDDQLLAQIVQHLLCPKEGPVQASRDHANAIHEANQDGVKAYAKIAAQDWTFYVTKLNVNIGRSSEAPGSVACEEGADSNSDDWVHIDLGPSKMVSRQHARIFFNPEEMKWFLEVRGRNGIKVNHVPLKQANCCSLQSGDVLDVGGNEMMFVLPTEISTLHIHQMYLKRAGLSKQDLANSVPSPSREETFEGGHSLGIPGPSRRTLDQSYSQPIAPAPPNYKRLGTPPAPERAHPSHHMSVGYSGSGTLLLSQSNIDLSHDDNRHVKPQFSYAQMITQAIMSVPNGKLNLNGIYTFITTNYAYYRHQPPAGWQNSIRHNLSLNKAFDKVARSTHEPGKGMKWQIVPEAREEMTRNAYRGGRGGHRGSSAPTSPSQLSYITHGPGDVVSRESGSALKRKPLAGLSPLRKPTLRAIHITPDRATGHQLMPAVLTADGSPLPRSRKAVTGPSPSSCSNLQDQSPTLTSSYLQEDGASFVTPAPHRVHPRLAPPSTAQRPSQHMPTSSPAPFWKYADIGSTPLKPVAHLDLSPSRLASGLPPHGSSPPLAGKSPLLYPTGDNDTQEQVAETYPVQSLEMDEDQGFDLAKSFILTAPGASKVLDPTILPALENW